MLLVAALLGLFLVAAWFAVPRKPKYPQTTLKDGRIIQLAAVTVGPSHGMQSSGLRNFLFNFMPSGIKKELGPSFNSTFGFQYNGIGLWLLCYDPALQQYTPGAIANIAVIDEHGCKLDASGSGGTSDGFHHATIFNLSNFPRDLDQITCQLFAPGSSNALGQIVITNPVRTASVQWSSQSLPITVTNGNIAVRLQTLPAPNVAPQYVVFENDKPKTEWSIQQFHFEDGFGNAGPNLCRKQAAWKLKARFSRNETADFASNELCRITNVKLPSPGVRATFNLTNRVGADEVILRHVVGPGSYDLSNGVIISSIPWTNGMGAQFGIVSKRARGGGYNRITTRAQNETAVIVAHPPLDGLREMLIRARFEDRVVAASRTGNSDGTATYFDLNWRLGPNEVLPTNAPLELEIIVQKALEFEFLVKPDDAVKTAESVL